MPPNVPHWGVDIEGRPAVWLKGTDVVELVGEALHQQHLQQIAGGAQHEGFQLEVAAWLVPEPPNPHDAQPIGAWIAGALVGHMPRVHAAVWRPAILAIGQHYGRPVACHAKVVGGWRRHRDAEGGFYGVRLFLPPPPL